MPEIRTVESMQVDERCNQCLHGYMRPTGIVLISNPPQYPHKCNKCNHTQTYGVQYPYIVQQ